MRSFLSFIITAWLCGGNFLMQPAKAQQVSIYVSANGDDHAAGSLAQPVKTLQRARQLARMLRQQYPPEPIAIFLREGIYYLDTTLVLTSEDNPGGKAPITYRAYPHEKVVISGGRRLRLQWEFWKNGIYRAKLPASLQFDQLFVNGIKQVRARYPNYDSSVRIFNGVSPEALSIRRIRTWQHPAGGYIHALQQAHWGSLHYRITGKDAKGKLQLEGGYQINRSHRIDSGNVFVENIFEELDTAHEWYYDNTAGLLYYMPPAGLNLRQAKIEVPVLQELVAFKGSADKPVSNIHFRDILFTHTTETFMLTQEPLLRGDWNIYRGGAVFLDGTAYCSFSNCDFESPGGNTIFFNNYNRYDTIEHCLIRNAGASGICFVGNPQCVRSPSFNYDQYVPYSKMDKTPGPQGNDFPQQCLVHDNLITGTGRIEKQTAGVQLSMCMDIGVVHNTIYNVPRAGINVNDGTWGGHYIADNDVFNTVLETGDHGAFNSWGRDRYWSPDRAYMDSLTAVHSELVRLDVIHPVTIRHNRFRCDHGWDIDLDDGSGNYIIDSNLCLNGGIKLREGFYRQVKNNIAVNNTFHPHVWFKNSHDLFMHNIVMKPYAPIQVAYWGDTVDNNLFPDTVALLKARAAGTDRHSAASYPRFYDPGNGDYRVQTDAAIQAVHFRNFTMDDFGVISPRLKAIAQQPPFSLPERFADNTADDLFQWKGAWLKQVSGLGEQSALGLAKAEGVYITRIEADSPASREGLRKNDVILKVEDMTIRTLADLLQVLQNYHARSPVRITIFRDQQVQILTDK